MTEQIRIINLILVVIGLAISIVGLLQVSINRNIEKRTRVFFITLFSVLSVYLLLLLTRGITFSKQGDAWVILSEVTFFGQALMASILTVIMTAFLLYESGDKNWARNKLFWLTIGLWLIYVAILIYNIFSRKIYYVDVDNTYYRGPLFPVLVAPTLLIGAVNLLAVYLRREKLSAKQRHAFVVYAVVPMFAMAIQAQMFGIHLIALSLVIAAIFMVVYIISDQTERYYMKEAENAKLKMDILLAQIQPHFLFNSLTTIKHLCVDDPIKAQEAIEQFMIYLRHNMDSITSDRPIAFEKELDHVKGYLALQQLRFGKDLSVEYDIAYTKFELPALTLQPLVENAVTYGVRKNDNGKGTVKIITRHKGNFVEVIVEDDGPGFITANATSDKEKSHVGLMNVKERIENIAGGELLIDSVMGAGTKATIRVSLGDDQC